MYNMDHVIDINSRNFKKEKKKEKTTCCGYICIIFCALITIPLFLILPITEIFLGTTYNNEITCNTTMFVSIDKWLIIKGSVSLFFIITACVTNIFEKNSICKCLSTLILYIGGIFTFIWLIIGSIIFWRDCPNLTPNFINIFMWVSLILGYISILTIPSNKL